VVGDALREAERQLEHKFQKPSAGEGRKAEREFGSASLIELTWKAALP